MKRSERAAVGAETVQIVEAGRYTAPSGRVVDITPWAQRCFAGTRKFTPEELSALRDSVARAPAGAESAVIEIANETTLSGVARALADGPGPVAALNFASARNPGGGFLGGSQAQEESLARSSALYASLLKVPAFYERHRRDSCLLYSDAIVWSPDCPIFRDDEGTLLEQPRLASFITCAAPNAGAIANSQPHLEPHIASTFARRCEAVLAIAAEAGCPTLVLGAWGCGVFRNDPRLVAHAFAKLLLSGSWRMRFARIVFSVLDTTPEQATFGAFHEAFAEA